MEKVYSADSLVDGQMLVDYLNENGVPAVLFNQNASGGLGELPVTHPEVWVKQDSDLQCANALLQNYFGSSPTTVSWQCLTCKEICPGSFEICWQCGSPLHTE